jgi:hypothetical protein
MLERKRLTHTRPKSTEFARVRGGSSLALALQFSSSLAVVVGYRDGVVVAVPEFQVDGGHALARGAEI